MTSNELEIFKQSILDDVRVMMQTTGQVTQYIGARYVPLFAEPLDWSADREYEPLTIVLYQGNSFTSRQFVPKGIPITNKQFWAVTGNYNAQIEQYRQEVENLANNVNGLKTKYVRSYDNINAMCSDTEIQNGMICKTLNRSSNNDNGGAYYIITNNGNVNNIDVLQCPHSLTATLVYMDTMVDAQFGEPSKQIITHIFTAMANKKLSKIKFINNYDIDGFTEAVNMNGADIEISGGAFTCSPSANISNIFFMKNTGNVIIDNCYFKSNMNSNFDAVTPAGHSNTTNAKSSNVYGVNIFGHKNVVIRNCYFDGMHSAAFIQDKRGTKNGDIRFEDSTIINSGGMGIYADNFKSLNVININGYTVDNITGGMHFVYGSDALNYFTVKNCEWKAAKSDYAPVVFINNEKSAESSPAFGSIDNCNFIGDIAFNSLNYTGTVNISNTHMDANAAFITTAILDIIVSDCFVNGNKTSHLITTNKQDNVTGSVNIYNTTFNNMNSTFRIGEVQPNCIFKSCIFLNSSTSVIRPSKGSANIIFDSCDIFVNEGVMYNYILDTFTGNITVSNCNFHDSPSQSDFIKYTGSGQIYLYNNYGRNVTKLSQDNINLFNNLYKS